MTGKYQLAVMLIIIVLSACQNADENAKQVSDSGTKAKAAATNAKKQKSHDSTTNALNAWQEARVVYQRMEGGFYGLVTNDGRKLLPLNLDKQYQQDGAVIQIKGENKTDVMTIQQWGKPFKITSIKLIKEGRKKVPNN